MQQGVPAQECKLLCLCSSPAEPADCQVRSRASAAGQSLAQRSKLVRACFCAKPGWLPGESYAYTKVLWLAIVPLQALPYQATEGSELGKHLQLLVGQISPSWSAERTAWVVS